MKKAKISLVLNILIFLNVIFAAICMFTGFRFMSGPDIQLEASNIGMFSFFTVDSNVFMAIVALIYAYYDYKIIKKEKRVIPRKISILKLMATSGVTLTFFVVFTYLGYIVEDGLYSLLLNSNLFLHLIVPVLSIITFVFFEKTDKLKFKDTFFGLVPMMLYAIYYLLNVLIHMENGRVSPRYDWYWFFQNGVWTMLIVVPVMILIDYALSYLLWKFNKEK